MSLALINLFNPTPEVRSHFSEASYVVLAIYDGLGRKVLVLVEDLLEVRNMTLIR